MSVSFISQLLLLSAICSVSYQINYNIKDDNVPIKDTPVSNLTFNFRTQLNNTKMLTQELPSNWNTFIRQVNWPVSQTAVIIVDMWDAHWCDTEVRRGIQIAQGINHTITKLRNRGVQIIHSPANCMDAYKTHPSYIRAQNFSQVLMPPIPPPEPWDYLEPWYTDPPYPLTLAPGSGGCDGTGDSSSTAWEKNLKQLDTIYIDPAVDLISAEDGWWPNRSQGMFNILMGLKIKNVIFMGSATNMCLLGRPFGIKAARTWGMNVVLVRELTDVMFNPVRDLPYVSHDEATQLQISFIEKVWAGTTSMYELFY